MAIPEVRFTALDQEFNSAMTTIKNSNPKDIVNTASNAVTTKGASVLESVKKIRQGFDLNTVLNNIDNPKNILKSNAELNKILDGVDNLKDSIRRVRGLSKTSINLGGLGNKVLERVLGSVFKNDTNVQNMMRIIGRTKFGKALSDFTIGKPFKPVLVLPNGSTPPPGRKVATTLGNPEIDYESINTVLGRVSGNNYSQTVVDKNVILRQAVTVGNMAYDANMTGVIQALQQMPGMTPDVLARVVAILMTEQSSKGNTSAILDMSSGTGSVVVSSTSGPVNGNSNVPLNASPSILTDLFANLKKIPGSSDSESREVCDSLFGSAGNLDPNWNISKDGLPSVKYLEEASPDLLSLIKSKLMNHSFSPSNLTVTFGGSEDLLLAAMMVNDPNGVSSLRNLSRNSTCSSSYCAC